MTASWWKRCAPMREWSPADRAALKLFVTTRERETFRDLYNPKARARWRQHFRKVAAQVIMRKKLGKTWNEIGLRFGVSPSAALFNVTRARSVITREALRGKTYAKALHARHRDNGH